MSLCLSDRYPWTGNVRGIGLFQGIEFVKDKHAKDLVPHPELTKFVVDYLRYSRVIVSRDGPDENVIKVKPPMVFSKSDVDVLVSNMDKALAAAQKLGKY
jgi:4-aminobutyrate aminotransferase-like enzyme